MISWATRLKFDHRFLKNLCAKSSASLGIRLHGQFLYRPSCNRRNYGDISSSPDCPTKVSPVQMTFTSFKSTSDHNFTPAPPIVIMHGLLGSKTNWKSMGKVINQQTGRTVYTVDARNHGESPHSEEIDYYTLAADILYFLKDISVTKACLIGHSMGGRAVMTVALHNPEVVEKLFVLDISPVGISENLSALPRFVEVMKKTELPDELELHEGRKYVDQCLTSLVPESAVRLFLLSNLIKQNGKFTWKVNLEAIGKNFNPHLSTFPPAKSGKVFERETYFIGGALSNYIRTSDHDAIRKSFPNALFSYVQDAGHSLHAENPEDFLKTIIPLIKG